jgi:hypothetical protein
MDRENIDVVATSRTLGDDLHPQKESASPTRDVEAPGVRDEDC